mmetsp:Transcript_5569/g.7754  ORF Transcript_5569/g.7754 Transcript_5569/m.7754 type:complete len:260 (-) Transcript_5569:125-904(-)
MISTVQIGITLAKSCFENNICTIHTTITNQCFHPTSHAPLVLNHTPIFETVDITSMNRKQCDTISKYFHGRFDCFDKFRILLSLSECSDDGSNLFKGFSVTSMHLLTHPIGHPFCILHTSISCCGLACFIGRHRIKVCQIFWFRKTIVGPILDRIGQFFFVSMPSCCIGRNFVFLKEGIFVCFNSRNRLSEFLNFIIESNLQITFMKFSKVVSIRISCNVSNIIGLCPTNDGPFIDGMTMSTQGGPSQFNPIFIFQCFR